jgi:hypothetical protein
MLSRNYRFQPGSRINWVLTCTAVILIVICLLLPSTALASSKTRRGPIYRAQGGPTFQVKAGFDGHYRDGNWVPVQVALSNTGPDFSGTLSIDASSIYSQYTRPGSSGSLSYQMPITLPGGAQKQVTLYVPLNNSAYNGQSFGDITVKLLDSAGRVVGTQPGRLNPVGTNDVLVGVLSDQSTSFGPLSSVSLPSQGSSVISVSLNASTMPTIAAVLKNFDLVVLDNFTTSTLSKEQLDALQSWVNSGGALIIVGGPEWRQTLAPLPPGLLPVVVNDTSTLPAGSPLLPVGSSAKFSGVNGIMAPVVISRATIAPQFAGSASETVLAYVGRDKSSPYSTPLILQAHQGEGIISYLAFDPALEPIVGWAGASALWKSLVVRTVGEHLFAPTSGVPGGFVPAVPSSQASGMDNLLQYLLPNGVPSLWLLLGLFLGYVFILGPGRYLLVRFILKQRIWSWRIVLSTIVLFSLFTYGLALYQRGANIQSNSISVIRLSPGGSSAHITSYLLVFTPNEGDFHIRLPGNSLVQPLSQGYDNSFGGRGQFTTSITPGQDKTIVDLQNVSVGSPRSLLSEQDWQVHGGIISHLALQNGILTGTVTNTLDTGLSNVYLLMSSSFVSIGHLAAGQTLHVNLTLRPPAQNMSLADEIAESNGLQTPYTYSYNQAPNQFQRRMQELTVLSGEDYSSGASCNGGPCPVPVAPGGKVIFVNGTKAFYNGGGPPVVSGGDPLLIEGAPATLIGWADRSLGGLDDLTVNEASTKGIHDSLVQAPLSVDFSGAVNLPSSAIEEQLVDVQGSNVQIAYSGIYTMTTGGVTFEFVVPGLANSHLSSLTISEPSNLLKLVPQTGQGTPPSDAFRLVADVYNWHTGSWDNVPWSQYDLTISNVSSYIGPDGRILVQFANQDSTLGTVVFARPTLTLQE